MSDPYGTVVERERENMEKVSAWSIALGLVVLCGLAGSAEARTPEAEGVVAPAWEVAIQTWYTYPQAKRERYCDHRKVRKIVRKNHRGATPKGKRELRKAYRVLLKDC